MQPHPLRQHFTNWLSEWWQEYFSRSFRNCTGRPWAFSWVEVQMRLVPLASQTKKVCCSPAWSPWAKNSSKHLSAHAFVTDHSRAGFDLEQFLLIHRHDRMVSSYMSLLAPSETFISMLESLGGDVIGRSSDIHWYSICFLLPNGCKKCAYVKKRHQVNQVLDTSAEWTIASIPRHLVFGPRNKNKSIESIVQITCQNLAKCQEIGQNLASFSLRQPTRRRLPSVPSAPPL